MKILTIVPNAKNGTNGYSTFFSFLLLIALIINKMMLAEMNATKNANKTPFQPRSKPTTLINLMSPIPRTSLFLIKYPMPYAKSKKPPPTQSPIMCSIIVPNGEKIETSTPKTQSIIRNMLGTYNQSKSMQERIIKIEIVKQSKIQITIPFDKKNIPPA